MKVKRDIILYIWESVTKTDLATGNFHKFLIRITTEITNRLNKEKYIDSISKDRLKGLISPFLEVSLENFFDSHM